MRFNYDLTVILPGVRTEFWPRIFDETKKACKRYPYEFILVGPYVPQPELLKLDNFKYLHDKGHPARALHMGTLIAEGRFFTWLSDDAWVIEDSLDKCLDLMLSKNPEKDIVTIRYSEGTNHAGQEPPNAYWTSSYHGDLRLPGINQAWAIAPVMMTSLAYYKSLGGIDCLCEHMNMNIHDFLYRAQRNGSAVHLSPTLVMNCDWEDRNPANSSVLAAYHENDWPVFHSWYHIPDNRPIVIDTENWRHTAPVWHRRKIREGF